MSELIRDVELADQLKVSVDVVTRYTKEAGLAPHKLIAGGTTLHLYDKAAAVKELTARIARDRKPEQKVAPTPEPSVGDRVFGSVVALHDKAAALEQQLHGVGEDTFETLELLRQVNLQGPALLKAIQGVAELVQKAVAEMREHQARGVAEDPVPTPALQIEPPPVSSPPPAKASRPMVMVVGVHSTDRTHLEREFHECLDVRCFTPAESEGAAFVNLLGKAAEVFVSSRQLGTRPMGIVKANRQTYVRITGGLSQIREKVTEFYANLS